MIEPIKDTIPILDRLIKIRDSFGLTQKDFAKNIFVSQTYYSNIENGNKKMNDRVIALICSQYGVNKQYLLYGEGEMFSENLADLQLQTLLEIFNQLEKPFKEYIILQVKHLMNAIDESKEKKDGKSNRTP